jgi:hypothetical protein
VNSSKSVTILKWYGRDCDKIPDQSWTTGTSKLKNNPNRRIRPSLSSTCWYFSDAGRKVQFQNKHDYLLRYFDTVHRETALSVVVNRPKVMENVTVWKTPLQSSNTACFVAKIGPIRCEPVRIIHAKVMGIRRSSGLKLDYRLFRIKMILFDVNGPESIVKPFQIN